MAVMISPKPPAAPVPAPQLSPAPAPDAAVAVEGEPITMPNVEQPPAATGAAPVVSDGAEFEVLHTIVGRFRHGSYNAGDRIKASDLGPDANIDRLVKLEALKPLADAPAPQAETGKAKK